MKKLLVVCAALISIAVPVRAEPARRKYLVATEKPFREEMLGKRSHVRFTGVDGYAVELSDEEAKVLASASGVRYVEPDVERFVSAMPSAGPSPHLDVTQLTPWGVVSVRAPSVWFLTRGEGVRVGIIDTGIDLGHPDLQAAYRGGYDFVHNDAVPEEEAEGGGFGHGTRMAGIIAASDNGFGLIGAAPGVSLDVLKIFPRTGGALTSNVIRAVEWAIAHKLDVVSCSFGGIRRRSSRKRLTPARAGRTCSSSRRSATTHRGFAIRRHTHRWSAWERWIAPAASPRFRIPAPKSILSRQASISYRR